MIPWYWMIPAIIISAVFGFLVLALCMASREADERQKRPNEKEDT